MTRPFSTSKSPVAMAARLRRKGAKPVEPRGRLGLPFLKRRADDRGQVADILGDQKIMFHEPLDAGETAPRRIAKPVRDPALMVEAQSFFRPAG